MTLDDFINAIGGQETGGRADQYTTENASGHYGRFQIAAGNWPSWSREAGLGENATRSGENQEKVARFKMQQYYDKFGNWEDVAAAWYSGGPRNVETYDRPQKDGPTIREYVSQVMARAGGSGASTEEADSGQAYAPDPVRVAETRRLKEAATARLAEVRARYIAADPDVKADMMDENGGSNELGIAMDELAYYSKQVSDLETQAYDRGRDKMTDAISLGDYQQDQADRAWKRYLDRRSQATEATVNTISAISRHNADQGDIEASRQSNSGVGPQASVYTYLPADYAKTLKKYEQKFGVGDAPSGDPSTYGRPPGTTPPRQFRDVRPEEEAAGGWFDPNEGSSIGGRAAAPGGPEMYGPAAPYGPFKDRQEAASRYGSGYDLLRLPNQTWGMLQGLVRGGEDDRIDTGIPGLVRGRGSESSGRDDWAGIPGLVRGRGSESSGRGGSDDDPMDIRPRNGAERDALDRATGGDEGGQSLREKYPPKRSITKDAKWIWRKRKRILNRFADGTMHAPGGAARVGEQGPETMIDPRTGQPMMIGEDGPEVRDVPEGAEIYPTDVPPDQAYAYSQMQRAVAQDGGKSRGSSMAEAEMRANDPDLQLKVLESLRNAIVARTVSDPPATPQLKGTWTIPDPWADWRGLNGEQPQAPQAPQGVM